MVVGHNPGLEELVESLSQETVILATAALARIDLQIQHWPEISEKRSAKLTHLWRPKKP